MGAHLSRSEEDFGQPKLVVLLIQTEGFEQSLRERERGREREREKERVHMWSWMDAFDHI